MCAAVIWQPQAGQRALKHAGSEFTEGDPGSFIRYYILEPFQVSHGCSQKIPTHIHSFVLERLYYILFLNSSHSFGQFFFTMVAFSSLFLATFAVAGVLGAPRPEAGKILGKRATATPNGEGVGDDGFFFSIWSNDGDDMTFNNGGDGEYSLTWSGDGDVVCGKGWETGSDR